MATLLARMDEIILKKKNTRKFFVRKLIRNVKKALETCSLTEGSVSQDQGRLLISVPEEKVSETVNVLKRVFGIVSISQVETATFSTFNEIISKAEALFKNKIEGKTFSVKVKRVGKHDFTSLSLTKSIGAALSKYGKVNLKKPQVTVYVEVRDKTLLFYGEKIKGSGGLPIGTNGKVVALISGGFDSTVAAWYLLKRGAEVYYVFCNLGGEIHKEKTLKVVNVLVKNWSYGYKPKMYIFNFQPLLEEIRRNCLQNYWNIVLKRFMYRAAEKVALEIKAEGIVTGESLGQVSSQTLTNLYVSSEAVNTQILRPLIGFDKKEIIEKTRLIGSYEKSSQVKEYCRMVPRHPKTKAKLEQVKKEEAKINKKIIHEIFSQVEVVELRKEKKGVTEAEYGVEVSEIPENAVLIDLRNKEEFNQWSYPGSLNIPLENLLQGRVNLEKNKTYLLLCKEGVVSKEIAFNLKLEGFKVYSLRGGIEKLRNKGKRPVCSKKL